MQKMIKYNIYGGGYMVRLHLSPQAPCRLSVLDNIQNDRTHCIRLGHPRVLKERWQAGTTVVSARGHSEERPAGTIAALIWTLNQNSTRHRGKKNYKSSIEWVRWWNYPKGSLTINKLENKHVGWASPCSFRLHVIDVLLPVGDNVNWQTNAAVKAP